MTNARLRAMDKRFYTRALTNGSAELADYVAAEGDDPIEDCVVLVDREGKQGDGRGGVTFVAGLVRITAFRDHVPARPPAGATFTIGAEVFRVKQIERFDESRWVCVCPA